MWRTFRRASAAATTLYPFTGSPPGMRKTQGSVRNPLPARNPRPCFRRHCHVRVKASTPLLSLQLPWHRAACQKQMDRSGQAQARVGWQRAVDPTFLSLLMMQRTCNIIKITQCTEEQCYRALPQWPLCLPYANPIEKWPTCAVALPAPQTEVAKISSSNA